MAAGSTARADADRKFFVGLARAFGGAVFFSLPVLMTMEMWALASYMPRYRIALLIVMLLPLLFVLDRFSGFMATSSWGEDALDALIALGAGALAATVILLALGQLRPGMPLHEIVGRITLQTVPASFGAVLANSQFSAERGQERDREAMQRRARYPAQLFFMIVGAVFLAFNIAPTEEIVLLAASIGSLHVVGMLGLTLAMMHAFVYASGFRGRPRRTGTETGSSLFLRYTVVGYALALLVSAYVLWTFGRLDGIAPATAIAQTVILGLPAGLGAAAARLVL